MSLYLLWIFSPIKWVEWGGPVVIRQSMFLFLITLVAFLYAYWFQPTLESGMKKLSLKNDVNLSKSDLFGIYDWGILFVVFPDFINE